MRQLKISGGGSTGNGMKQITNAITALTFELLNGVTKIHMAHLKTTSYSAHVALGDFYDGVGDFADSLAEQWQGITEKLLEFPTSSQLPTYSTPEECVKYLRGLYDMCDKVQDMCEHSEIINTIDEIKSLINRTKYKLIFLK
jgi:hypothetical protein